MLDQFPRQRPHRVQRGGQFLGKIPAAKQTGNLDGCLTAGEDAAEIAWTAATERQARQRTRHVRHVLQRGAQVAAEGGLVGKRRDRIEPGVDALRVRQRRHQTFGEQPRAAAGHRAVQRLQERTVAIAGLRLHEFEIGASGRIDEQRRGGTFALRRAERRTFGDLGLFDIGNGGRSGGEFGAGKTAEAVERLDAIIAGDAVFSRGAVEQHGRLRNGDATENVDDRAHLRIVEDGIGKDQFARLDAQDIGEQPRFGGFGQPEDAGRDIDPGKRDRRLRAAANAGERHQVVRFGRREQLVFGDRAGGDEAHDVALDDRFGAALLRFRRVLDLFADGHAKAEPDQLLQIVIGRMDRHAAHRNFLAEMLAALRQRDAERARRFDRVLEEQFVEIAHPVEQQRIRIVRLDLDDTAPSSAWPWRGFPPSPVGQR